MSWVCLGVWWVSVSGGFLGSTQAHVCMVAGSYVGHVDSWD